MSGRPTERQLYDAILNLQGAMLHGFSMLDARMGKLETRFAGLEKRFHEFDEDEQSFRIEVRRRFDRIDGGYWSC